MTNKYKNVFPKEFGKKVGTLTAHLSNK